MKEVLSMKTLSEKIISRYNYSKIRDYVENDLFRLIELGIKLTCLLPPGAERRIFLLENVNESKSSESKQEKYIEKKDYIEREIKKEMEKNKDSFNLMTEEEMIIFEEIFIYQNTEQGIEEKYCWSKNKIIHLKKSFLIKYALSKGQDFEK